MSELRAAPRCWRITSHSPMHPRLRAVPNRPSRSRCSPCRLDAYFAKRDGKAGAAAAGDKKEEEKEEVTAAGAEGDDEEEEEEEEEAAAAEETAAAPSS